MDLTQAHPLKLFNLLAFFFQINVVCSIQLPMYTVADPESEELAVVHLKKTTLVEMLCIINLPLQQVRTTDPLFMLS